MTTHTDGTSNATESNASPAGRLTRQASTLRSAVPSQGHAAAKQLAGRAHGSHRDYARWRARQIAYGRWEPWADAAPVREHVRRLRRFGASYHAIGQAAGVSAMTVHRLLNGCPAKRQAGPDRIGAAQARRLLAVTSPAACPGRRDACGSRRRLQALVAIGHSPAFLAGQLRVPPRQAWRVLRGEVRTVTPAMHARICGAYETWWNQCPPERTRQQQEAAADAARDLAQAQGWPPPMALDDDRIDDPAYRVRTAWRRAAGTAAAPSSARPAHRPGGARSGSPESDHPQIQTAEGTGGQPGRHPGRIPSLVRRPLR